MMFCFTVNFGSDFCYLFNVFLLNDLAALANG